MIIQAASLCLLLPVMACLLLNQLRGGGGGNNTGSISVLIASGNGLPPVKPIKGGVIIQAASLCLLLQVMACLLLNQLKGGNDTGSISVLIASGNGLSPVKQLKGGNNTGSISVLIASGNGLSPVKPIKGG